MLTSVEECFALKRSSLQMHSAARRIWREQSGDQGSMVSAKGHFKADSPKGNSLTIWALWG